MADLPSHPQSSLIFQAARAAKPFMQKPQLSFWQIWNMSFGFPGIAWLSILSMPYAMVAPALSGEKVGMMMGMFNFFIVLPQIAASSLLGFALKHFLHNEPVNALVLGGGH